MALSTTVFAPTVRAVQPAFVYNDDSVIIINFTWPAGEYEAVGVSITDPNKNGSYGNNSTLLSEKSIKIITDIQRNEDNGEYYIEIPVTDLKELTVNQYYQVQLWGAESDGEIITDPSQITYIYPINKPDIQIDGVNEDDVLNTWDAICELKGKIIDSKEQFFSYSCYLVDPDTEEETLISALTYGQGTNFKLSLDRFMSPENDEYKLKFKYTTNHGYSGEKIFTVSQVEYSLDIDKNFLVTCSKDYTLNANVITITTKDYNAGINFCLKRRKDTEYYLYGETIATFASFNQSEFIFKDYNIESGQAYKYFITYIDTNENHCQSYPSDTIELIFEDIMLSDDKDMIAIRYNPNISGFKYVVQESVTNTLGGKYPIIRRSGDVKYTQFNLSGMIAIELFVGGVEGSCSYDYLDMSEFFTNDDSLFSTETNPLGQLEIIDKSVAETRARKYIMAFLTNGKPKLFRSAEEGNMIVYLSNISFTPNKQLGRHIYDFSATVTEMCEYNLENLNKYELIGKDFRSVAAGNANSVSEEEKRLVPNAVKAEYMLCEDFMETSLKQDEPKKYLGLDELSFLAYDYLPNFNGKIVPVIYKEAEEGKIDIEDQFFYVGTEKIEDKIYDKWRKIENDEIGREVLGWASDSKMYFFTNRIVKNNKIIDSPVIKVAAEKKLLLVPDKVKAYYSIYDDFEDHPTEDKPKDYRCVDSYIFIAYNYEENNSGEEVPVIYKVNIDDYESDPNWEVDTQDKFFYMGTEEIDGSIYDKWRKIETDEVGSQLLNWTSTSELYFFTNQIVEDNTIINNVIEIASSDKKELGLLKADEIEIAYSIYKDVDGANPWDNEPVDYKKDEDVFVAYDYLFNSDGVMVPVIYKTDGEQYLFEADYSDPFFYVGTQNVDGTTYDKWRKIEIGNDVAWEWESESKIYILTNSIVKNNKFIDRVTTRMKNSTSSVTALK